MQKYKFKGGDRVLVNANNGLLAGTGIKSFSGTVIAPISDLPILNTTYVILADNPEDAGLNSQVYPFSAAIASENELTSLPN